MTTLTPYITSYLFSPAERQSPLPRTIRPSRFPTSILASEAGPLPLPIISLSPSSPAQHRQSSRLEEAFVPTPSSLRRWNPDERDEDEKGEDDFRLAIGVTPRARAGYAYHSPSNPFSRSPQPIFSPGRCIRFPSTPRRHHQNHTGLRNRLELVIPLADELMWLRKVFFRHEIRISLRPEKVYSTVIRVLFWAAMIVFLSALFGVGYTPEVKAVRRPVESGLVKWQGGWEVSQVGTIAVGEYRDHLEGIWDAARKAR